MAAAGPRLPFAWQAQYSEPPHFPCAWQAQYTERGGRRWPAAAFCLAASRTTDTEPCVAGAVHRACTSRLRGRRNTQSFLSLFRCVAAISVSVCAIMTLSARFGAQ